MMKYQNNPRRSSLLLPAAAAAAVLGIGVNAANIDALEGTRESDCCQNDPERICTCQKQQSSQSSRYSIKHQGHGKKSQSRFSHHHSRQQQPHDHKNPKCPPERPILHYEPESSSLEAECVACVAYTDHPAAPDRGCTDQEPLCMQQVMDDANGNNETNWERPPTGRTGTMCRPYPCHYTRARVGVEDQQIDEGCTPTHPFCVDALGNDPPLGGPGMKCIPSTSAEVVVDDEAKLSQPPKAGWGMLERHAAFLKHSGDNAATKAAAFSILSLCTGCPLSGQGRSCEATKACDTLGGTHSPWSW